MTIELSTNDPTANANPISEITFSDIPCVVRRKKVKIADIGIENPTTNAALAFFRKMKSIITAIIRACSPELVTLKIDSFTLVLLSSIIT